MAKDPAYIRDALLVDDGGVNVPQHSSGSHFGGGSTRNKTIGRGMRSISSKVLPLSSSLSETAHLLSVSAKNQTIGRRISSKVFPLSFPLLKLCV